MYFVWFNESTTQRSGMREMKINNKSKYAVCAMISLATRGASGPIAIEYLAKIQGLSVSYMEQIFAKLKKANLVKSTRGQRGGYTVVDLDINVAQIIESITGQSAEAPGEDPRWIDISDSVKNHLSNRTLLDLTR